MSTSKIIYSSVSPAGIVPEGTPRVAFYGDTDDHLRAPALLTLQLRERYPELVGLGAACLDPDASWYKRLDGLQELLEDAGKLHGRAGEERPLALLENIEALCGDDALEVEDEEAEAPKRMLFGRERAGLRATLLGAAERRGIWVQTSGMIPAELEQAPTERYDKHEQWLRDLLVGVPLEVCDLVQRLVELDEEDPYRVKLIVDACPDDLTEYLLWETYTTLPARARDAARQIAALRGAQRYNGVLGDLKVDEQTIQAEAKVARRAVEHLMERGWLKRGEQDKLVMPWLLRSYALKQASMWTSDEQQTTWRSLIAAGSVAPRSPAQEMELHHRAVEALDIEAASKYSNYYVDDLIARGRRLSEEKDYRQAAQLFQAITEHLPKNAYAWEYLAFNLEHLARESGDDSRRDEIARGYREAYEITRGANPLFWARWLCWRIAEGALTEDQARAELNSARSKHQKHGGLKRLVELVEQAMQLKYRTRSGR